MQSLGIRVLDRRKIDDVPCAVLVESGLVSGANAGEGRSSAAHQGTRDHGMRLLRSKRRESVSVEQHVSDPMRQGVGRIAPCVDPVRGMINEHTRRGRAQSRNRLLGVGRTRRIACLMVHEEDGQHSRRRVFPIIPPEQFEAIALRHPQRQGYPLGIRRNKQRIRAHTQAHSDLLKNALGVFGGEPHVPLDALLLLRGERTLGHVDLPDPELARLERPGPGTRARRQSQDCQCQTRLVAAHQSEDGTQTAFHAECIPRAGCLWEALTSIGRTFTEGFSPDQAAAESTT